MDAETYRSFDAVGLTELVKNGEVEAHELYRLALEQIADFNPQVNAVIADMSTWAEADLATLDLNAPLAGVPFLVKDLEPVVGGVPHTMACRGLADYIPPENNEIVNRFKKAGLIILGKTNCPEMGLMGTTEPKLFGPTRNPFHLDHITGGSSGGSAAAVAMGMTPIASGGDGGGSIRIPASCCGLVGLKPTRGRTPLGPGVGEVWFGAVVSHGLTRTVRDCAALLDQIQGPEIGAPYQIPVPTTPYLQQIRRPPEKLRIAYNTRSPLANKVHPENVRAVMDTVEKLVDMGHEVEEAQPGYDGLAIAQSYFMIYFGEVDARLRQLEELTGRKFGPSKVEPSTYTLRLMGRRYSASDFTLARYAWNDVSRAYGRFFQTYDLFLTPTLAAPPAKIGQLPPKPIEDIALQVLNRLRLDFLLKWTGTLEKMMLKNLEATPFTQAANLTGCPAISLPMSLHDDGLPCGVHFTAPFGEEGLLLRLAAALEPHFKKAQYDPRLTNPAK